MTSTTDGTKDGPALYGAGGGWSETGLAWSNRPSHDATAAHDIAAIPKGTVADYNATSLVNGNGTLNLALISTTTTTSTSDRVSSPTRRSARS